MVIVNAFCVEPSWNVRSHEYDPTPFEFTFLSVQAASVTGDPLVFVVVESGPAKADSMAESVY